MSMARSELMRVGERRPRRLFAVRLPRARLGDTIEIWGDGKQTRSFMYIDDCVEGIYPTHGVTDYTAPLNLGSDELVCIDELADIVSSHSWKAAFAKRHELTRPQGVRGRNSDNSRLREVLKWEPSVSLRQGLVPTYQWIAAQCAARISPRIRSRLNDPS